MTPLRAAVIAAACGLLAGHWLSEHVDRAIARFLGLTPARWWR